MSQMGGRPIKRPTLIVCGCVLLLGLVTAVATSHRVCYADNQDASGASKSAPVHVISDEMVAACKGTEAKVLKAMQANPATLRQNPQTSEHGPLFRMPLSAVVGLSNASKATPFT